MLQNKHLEDLCIQILHPFIYRWFDDIILHFCFSIFYRPITFFESEVSCPFYYKHWSCGWNRSCIRTISILYILMYLMWCNLFVVNTLSIYKPIQCKYATNCGEWSLFYNIYVMQLQEECTQSALVQKQWYRVYHMLKSTKKDEFSTERCLF